MTSLPEQGHLLPNGAFSARHSTKDITSYSMVEEAFLESNEGPRPGDGNKQLPDK